MTLLVIETFIASLFLALIHLPIKKFELLDEKKRCMWLSFAGGVAVAYVFGRLLPELAEWQALIDLVEHPFYKTENFLQFFNYEIYIVALIGLVVFYGLHSLVYWKNQSSSDQSKHNIYRIHLICYSLYNVLIGYLMIHHHRMGFLAVSIIAVAMGFHLLANAYHIRERDRVLFDRFGKWILAASVLIGWLIGILTKLPDEVYITLFAFLLGGIVMNAIQDELPRKNQSHFWAFFIGVIIFTLFLVALYNIPFPEEIMKIHE